MMFDSRQVSLLTEMGIPVWQLRTQPEITPTRTEQAPVDTAELLNKINQSTWLVFHDGEGNPQAQRLLQSMLSTIGLSYKDICLMTQLDIDMLMASENISLTGTVLLLFGERAVQQCFGEMATVSSHRNETHFMSQTALTAIVSFGLQTLMQTPENKVLAWQDLQLAKSVQQPL